MSNEIMNKEAMIIYLTRENMKLQEKIADLEKKIDNKDNLISFWRIKNMDKKERIKDSLEFIEKNKLNGNKISEMLCGSEIVKLSGILRGECKEISCEEIEKIVSQPIQYYETKDHINRWIDDCLKLIRCDFEEDAIDEMTVEAAAKLLSYVQKIIKEEYVKEHGSE